ncbi:histone H2B [Coemansia sp. Benny D160-2]|nr:histone H2B [Coemansia sp. Benny D160-2]
MASNPSDEPAGELPVELVDDKKAHKIMHNETYLDFSTSIHRVMKQMYPDISISTNSIEIINSFINDIFERIASEASKVAAHSKKSTITAREIHAAVCILLPGDLSRQAVSEANKAIHKSFPPK